MFRFAVAAGCGFVWSAHLSSSSSSSASSESVAQAKAKYLPAYAPVETNSICFFDIEASSQSWFGAAQTKPLGRIEFELFDDTVPITTRNFRSLCKGDMGL